MDYWIKKIHVEYFDGMVQDLDLPNAVPLGYVESFIAALAHLCSTKVHNGRQCRLLYKFQCYTENGECVGEFESRVKEA